MHMMVRGPVRVKSWDGSGRCPVGRRQRRRREDVEKDPGGEEEKEHGYLVVSGRPIPSLLDTLPEHG